MSQTSFHRLVSSSFAGPVAAALLIAAPGAAQAQCVTQMGKVLMSSPAAAPAGAAPRAAMLRASAIPVAAPVAAPGAVRKAAPVRRAAPKPAPKRTVARPAAQIEEARVATAPEAAAEVRRPSPPRRKAVRAKPKAVAAGGAGGAAAAAPGLRPVVAPVPMAVAAQELATPRSFALVALTVCHADLGAPPAMDGLPAADGPAVGPAPVEIGPWLEDDPFDIDILRPPTTGPSRPPLPTAPFPPLTPGAVPEPSTWAMMIAGFGAVGAVLRRRRACPS